MRRLIPFLLLLAGCGKEGPPVVPEPRGPLPSGDVSVRQLGSTAEISAAVPGPRGPAPEQALHRAELLRVDFPPGTKPPADPGVFTRRGAEVAVSDGPFAPGGRVDLADPTLAALEPLEGRVLRYAVRWRDARGRPSPLATAPDLVVAVPPEVPRGVVAEAVPDGIRVRWQPPAGGAPAGYNVYRARGGEPVDPLPRNAEPLKDTEYLDPEIVLGTSYRYLVRVVAAPGRPLRESASSAPVPVVAADRFPPGAPRDLVAVREGEQVRMFWAPGAEPDLAGYRVERQVGEGPWEPVADGLTQAQWLDPAPPPGTVAYRVLALDRAEPPNVSAPSEPVQVAAPMPEASQP
jgi:hypothetical protein